MVAYSCNPRTWEGEAEVQRTEKILSPAWDSVSKEKEETGMGRGREKE